MILKKYLVGMAVLVLLLFSVQAFSQSNASIGGLVTDASGGVLPGATVVITNTDTGIAKTVLTNDTGAYNAPGLQVGTYNVSAELEGFQKKTTTGIRLVSASNLKVDFELAVAGITENVEVSVNAEKMQLESNASVGMVLPEQQVQDLPLVNSNVLDLIKVMGGVNMTNSPIWGGNQTTLAGITADQVNVQRDGVTVNDVRWNNGMGSPVHLNPEMVGEIKLVVAPVDAELGRGSGQIQVVTRSGANKYTGSAVWDLQNTALDANEWYNNFQGTQLDWRNKNEITLSYGGPIIKNKTFFFVSYNQQWSKVKQNNVNPIMPTPCARKGIFRYFEGYDNANDIATPSFGNANSSPFSSPWSIPVVDKAGNPAAYDYNHDTLAVNTDTSGNPLPALVPDYQYQVPGTGTDPDTNPAVYEYYYPNHGEVAQLKYQGVFGPLLQTPATNDCSDVAADPVTGLATSDWIDYGVADADAAANPTTLTPLYDPNRDHFDTTGYVSRFLALTPGAIEGINNYDVGDGLNWGGYRWTRSLTGQDNVYGVAENPDRKQINARIDHNITSNHRLSGTFTIENDIGTDQGKAWPTNSYEGTITRRPRQFSASLTSTLKPTLLNEARFGLSHTGSFVNDPFSNPSTGDIVRALLEPGACASGSTCTNLYQVDLPNWSNNLPLTIGLDGGFNIAGGSHVYGNGRGNHGTYWGGDDNRFVIADTVTWTRGRHSFRFGMEIQKTSSWQIWNGDQSFGSANAVYPDVIGGASNDAPNQGVYYPSTSTYNPYFEGIVGDGGSANVQGVYQLQNMLAGSVASVGQYYFINTPTATTYDNIVNGGAEGRVRELLQNNLSLFAQDEWKVTNELTLTLGMRYEDYGVPYLKHGMTVGLAEGSNSLFGISGRGWDSWFKYPDFTPCLGCNTFSGTYAGDPAELAYIGPGSPNPDQQVYGDDYNNFGPAIGFAWQIPYFGKGKTTLRGGYQLTYSTPPRADGNVTFAPGDTNSYTFDGYGYTGTPGNGYMDLTSLPSLIPVPLPDYPVPPAADPSIPLTRSVSYSMYDPNLRTPYVQRITVGLTRNLSSNMTLELKYVGNLSRKMTSGINLNSADFLDNGLIQAFTAARLGDDTSPEAGLLDQMFWGINIAGFGYAPVGTTYNGVYQSAAAQLRANSSTRGNLANGNFAGLASTIAGMNYTKTAQYYGNNDSERAIFGLPALPDPVANTLGGVLRYNGFPANYIVTSPQFNSATFTSNNNHNNYHSLQAQFTMRATRGLYFNGTYTWAKNLGSLGYTDVRNRLLDYGILSLNREHALQFNGTYELPFGRNRWLFSDVNSTVDKIIGGWQLSFIHTMDSGTPFSISTANSLYGGGQPNLVGSWDNNQGHVDWPYGARTGNYFSYAYTGVTDPQCNTLPSGPANGFFNFYCSLRAIQDADGNVIFNNPEPGVRGNYERNKMTGPLNWNTDMNFSKKVSLMEGKSLTIRFDARNIFNHPMPGWSFFAFSSGRVRYVNPPSGNMGYSSFWPLGYVDQKAGSRTFQGQVRLDF